MTKTNHTELTIERDIVIKGTHIRIKSIFTGQRSLDDALQNIIKLRMAEAYEDKRLSA